MLNIRADLIRKPEDFKMPCCVVEKIIEIPAEEFDDFIVRPYESRDFIRENKHFTRNENGVDHCMLVLGQNREDGVLVEADGYDWVRYGAYLSGARAIIEAQNQSPALKELNRKLTVFADHAAEECLKLIEQDDRAELSLNDMGPKYGVDMEGNGLLWDTVTEMIADRLEGHGLQMDMDKNELVFTRGIDDPNQTPAQEQIMM